MRLATKSRISLAALHLLRPPLPQHHPPLSRDRPTVKEAMGFRCREGPPLPVTATPTARTLDDRCTSKPVKLKRGFGTRDAPSGRDRTAAGRSQQAPDRELRKRPSAGASGARRSYDRLDPCRLPTRVCREGNLLHASGVLATDRTAAENSVHDDRLHKFSSGRSARIAPSAPV
jgi:hypothetical protein